MFLLLGGGEQGSGFSTVVSASAGPALSASNQSSASSDKYAALAELDSVFSSTATSSNAYTSTSNVSRYLLGVADFSEVQKSSLEVFLTSGFISSLTGEVLNEFRGTNATPSFALNNSNTLW